MTIDVTWGNPTKTYISVTFGESWTWSEFAAAHPEIDALLDEVEHRVNFLIDMRAGKDIPDRVELRTAKHLMNFTEPNSGVAAIVGAPPYLHLMIEQVLMPIVGNDAIHLVDSYEEAHALVTNAS